MLPLKRCFSWDFALAEEGNGSKSHFVILVTVCIWCQINGVNNVKKVVVPVNQPERKLLVNEICKPHRKRSKRGGGWSSRELGRASFICLMLTPWASCAIRDPDHKPRRVIKPPKPGSLVVFYSEQWWWGRLTENSIVAHRWLCSPSQHNKSPQGPLQLSGNNVLACLCLLNNIPLHWQAENIGRERKEHTERAIYVMVRCTQRSLNWSFEGASYSEVLELFWLE